MRCCVRRQFSATSDPYLGTASSQVRRGPSACPSSPSRPVCLPSSSGYRRGGYLPRMGQQKAPATMMPGSPPPPPPSSSLRYVDHTYRDYSRYIEEGGKLVKHKKSGNNFPARLHRVLSSTEHHAVISWMVSWISPVRPHLVVCRSKTRRPDSQSPLAHCLFVRDQNPPHSRTVVHGRSMTRIASYPT